MNRRLHPQPAKVGELTAQGYVVEGHAGDCVVLTYNPAKAARLRVILDVMDAKRAAGCFGPVHGRAGAKCAPAWSEAVERIRRACR